MSRTFPTRLLSRPLGLLPRFSFSLCLSAGLLLSFAGHAAAQAEAEEDEPREVPTVGDLAEIVPRLQSANPDEVREAIDLLAAIDRRQVVEPLAELLRSGRQDRITDRALQALRVVAEPDAIEVLTEFTNHRRVAARRRAYQALAEIDDARVAPILERGLRDSDRSVRGAAALALGKIDATDSLDVLFLAFERGVIEAAIAIGKIGEADSLERFDAFLGQQALGVMLSGYDHFLRRDDIELDVKKGIVERLGEVAGPMVRRFLQDYLRTLPERPRNRAIRTHKELVETTIRRIPEGSTASTGGSQ